MTEQQRKTSKRRAFHLEVVDTQSFILKCLNLCIKFRIGELTVGIQNKGAFSRQFDTFLGNARLYYCGTMDEATEAQTMNIIAGNFPIITLTGIWSSAG